MKTTERMKKVMKMFGVDIERLKSSTVRHKSNLEIRNGDICAIVGASGSGKSELLQELHDQTPEDTRINLDDIELEEGKSLIDCIEGDLYESLKILGLAGLSDVFCVLNAPASLSDGQQYRYRLARALASDKKLIFADNFCANLDGITAAVISHNIHKIAKKSNKAFILARCNDDLLCDLQPDIIVLKNLNYKTEVIYRDKKRQKL